MPTDTAGIIDAYDALRRENDKLKARNHELEYEVAACKDVAQEIREHDKELYRMLESIADGELAPNAPMVKRMLERVR